MSGGKFEEINCLACHKHGEELKPFSYKAKMLGENDVEVEITHCGISGTDIQMLENTKGTTQYPLVPGHEIIGKVASVGASVDKFKEGDRVGVGLQIGACLQKDCPYCAANKPHLCSCRTLAFNDKCSDETRTYGGFADAIRAQKDFIFKIPESIASEEAAPLMCAGVTVFAPMLRFGINPGDKVGIVGIGGLGHLAIQFAAKLGAEVICISESEDKEDDCTKLGANYHVNFSKSDEIDKVKNKLQYLFVTKTDNNPWDQYLELMDYCGHVIVLATPHSPVKFQAETLVEKCLSINGSLIGSVEEIEKTLEFAEKNDIKPLVECFEMSEVNDAIKRVKGLKVRYRAVLKN